MYHEDTDQSLSQAIAIRMRVFKLKISNNRASLQNLTLEFY
jgi:hypothetical protein